VFRAKLFAIAINRPFARASSVVVVVVVVFVVAVAVAVVVAVVVVVAVGIVVVAVVVVVVVVVVVEVFRMDLVERKRGRDCEQRRQVARATDTKPLEKTTFCYLPYHLHFSDHIWCRPCAAGVPNLGSDPRFSAL